MGERVSPSTLDGMTGDFLPRRQNASAKAQLLTILFLVAATALGIYLYS